MGDDVVALCNLCSYHHATSAAYVDRPRSLGSPSNREVSTMDYSQVTPTPPLHASGADDFPRRLLILTHAPARFAPFAAEADFVHTERDAICTLAAKQNEYRAVIAGVAEPDGRESGYRLVQLVRTQLQMHCPIYLFSPAPTPSSRAYALQCGATKLLTDDPDLISDLLLLLTELSPQEGVT